MALFAKSKPASSDLGTDILLRAGAAWWSLQLEGNTLAYSDNLQQWLKPGGDSLTLAEYMAALSDRDRQRLTGKLQSQAISRETFSIEHELRTAEGHKRYVRLQVQLHLGTSGKPERISGLVVDIGFESGERMLLSRVREATEFMETGILLLGPRLNPIWSNPAFTSLLGYAAEEFSGLNPFELLQGPGLTEKKRRAIQQELQEGGNLHHELHLLTKYGEPTWLQVEGRPQVDFEGTLLGYAVVFENINEIKAQQREIEQQKQDILDSIHHARRIQAALLPDETAVAQALPNLFRVYLPRDIVSGDFYYLFPLESGCLFAVVDCTGHGVPGAFMSALGHTNLNEVIRGMLMEGREPDPGEILRRLDKRIRFFLGQDGAKSSVNDGMDVCLVHLAPLTQGGYAVAYAGANRPLWHLESGQLRALDPVKLPIGGSSMEEKRFQTERFSLSKGDWIYLFTDGYSDQFGGPNHRKFGTKQLRETIASFTGLSCAEQHRNLEDTFLGWKGQTPQIDDVLLIGIGG